MGKVRSLTYEENQSATLADMHEYVEALERERDSLALALKAIKAYTIDPRAHERASKALATLDAGGRNRPPATCALARPPNAPRPNRRSVRHGHRPRNW